MASEIYEKELTTTDGKPLKRSSFRNGSDLTDAQKKCGSLKGKIKYYSEQLRCYFYVNEGIDPLEVEQKYLNRSIF